MAARNLICPHCASEVDEGSRAAAHAARTGLCKRCGKFLATKREAEAAARLADPSFPTEARKLRLRYRFFGALFFALGGIRVTSAILVALHGEGAVGMAWISNAERPKEVAVRLLQGAVGVVSGLLLLSVATRIAELRLRRPLQGPQELHHFLHRR